MRILVTGGAGFVGSHLTDALLAAGHHVVVLDDLSTGLRENLEQHRSEPRLELIVDTVLNQSLLAGLVPNVEAIFHLASTVGVRLATERPLETIENNSTGTSRMLKAAADESKPLLFASSSEVYGKVVEAPFSEDDDIRVGNTRTGRWAYGCSKALSEFLALAYYRERGLPVVITRLFNIVGSRQRPDYGMVVPRMTRQALRDEPITVYGDGSQTRCFCAVGEVVEALISLLADETAAGEVFNLGNDQEISMLELAERIRSLSGSRSEITTVPFELALNDQFEESPRRVPDLSKIRKWIGFEPRVSLDEMLTRFLDDERRRIAAGFVQV
ncbi:MAG: GDP-mannose 4,6-dehydratase [Thermoanaerobaculia bacterium]